MSNQFHFPPFALDANAEMRSGSKLYFYEPDTTTPKDVYSDANLSVVISQASGIPTAGGQFPQIFGSGVYDVVWKDSDAVTIKAWNDYDFGLPSGYGGLSAVAIEGGGTGATTAAAARANLGAASSDSVTALTQTVSDLSGSLGDLALLDSVTKSQLASSFAILELGRAYTNTKSNSSTTSSIPVDNTKPQIGEGTALFSQAYTPVAADSTLIIECDVQFGTSTTQTGVIALFKDSDADALAADSAAIVNNGESGRLKIRYEVSSGSTTARTYSIRMGTNAGTMTPDSVGFNGIQKSYLSIREVRSY